MDLFFGVGLLFFSDKVIDLVFELCEGNDCLIYLIVLDGMWFKVKWIYFENFWLYKLQYYNLFFLELSMYGFVRWEFKVGCLFIVESIVYVLKMLEFDIVGFDFFLEVFDFMIEDVKGF